VERQKRVLRQPIEGKRGYKGVTMGSLSIWQWLIIGVVDRADYKFNKSDAPTQF